MMQHAHDERRDDDVPDVDIPDVNDPDDLPAELSERDAASRIDALPDVGGAAAPACGRDDVGPGSGLP